MRESASPVLPKVTKGLRYQPGGRAGVAADDIAVGAVGQAAGVGRVFDQVVPIVTDYAAGVIETIPTGEATSDDTVLDIQGGARRLCCQPNCRRGCC